MRDLKIVLAAALSGAAIAVAAVFGLANAGYLPGTGDARIRAYLLSHPDIVAEMTGVLQQQQDAADAVKAAATMKKIGLAAFFDPKIAFVTGPADAKTSLVEFYDYDCPYCRASLPSMIKFYNAHKNDTRFSFIEFPIPALHGPGADLAAKASLAARRQPDKFVPFTFALMGQDGSLDETIIYDVAQKAGLDMAKLKADMADPAIDATLKESKALAARAGIDGTPTFIVNGVMHPGAVDDELLNGYIKQS